MKPIDVTDIIDVDPLEPSNSLAGWNTAKGNAAWRWKEQTEALPMPELRIRNYILGVDMPYREAPKEFLRELERIAPGHDVRWVANLGRWGLFKKQRVFEYLWFRGSLITVQDYFPRCVSLIEGPNESYLELSIGILKYIVNQNTRRQSPFEQVVEMERREKLAEQRREVEKEAIFQDHNKQAAELAAPNLRWKLGDTPNFSVFMPDKSANLIGGNNGRNESNGKTETAGSGSGRITEGTGGVKAGKQKTNKKPGNGGTPGKGIISHGA